MNALVLAIAGVLVVVGIALIAYSIVLARKQPAPEEPASAAPAPPLPTDSADIDEPMAFIDQPLKNDMAAALGHPTPPPADDDPTEETAVEEIRTQNDTDGNTRLDKED
jgi:hypothetical protein